MLSLLFRRMESIKEASTPEMKAHKSLCFFSGGHQGPAHDSPGGPLGPGQGGRRGAHQGPARGKLPPQAARVVSLSVAYMGSIPASQRVALMRPFDVLNSVPVYMYVNIYRYICVYIHICIYIYICI